MPAVNPAVKLLDLHPSVSDLGAEMVAGLKEQPKRLPPKYFYDQRGSQLFDQITRLDEYYPTRTEVSIMVDNLPDIVELVGRQASLIEFGSGSSTKTHILLENLQELAAYVPVDISREHLVEASEGIAARYPDVEVLPVCADFTRPFDLPDPQVMPVKNVVFFPGSTIGNFAPAAAQQLLDTIAQVVKKDGALLIGVDLKKDKQVLERAYNDALQVTAAFNLNMLVRMNAELGADFDIDAFEHRAIYNEVLGRIEMHLVSQREQDVRVDGAALHFDEGEYILTECSHKYSPDDFARLAMPAGFEVVRVWTDPDRLFSVQYLVCRR
ncbi:MAG: L-histidine N(alpha)-methyltransferase [Gammaproteobacteria bacterium]|nr:L-histidine N(alpha)-methyltransferase [Gammaproteobacteria bacterium]